MTYIRSAIAATLLAFGAAAVASAQSAPAAPARPHAHGQFGPGKALHRGGDRMLLRGIQLSDAEKANVKNVRAKYAAQAKTLRQEFKNEAKPQPADTAAKRARWQQVAAQRKQLMTAERAELRAALTPANQAKFDANVQQLEQRLAKRAEKMKANGAKRPARPSRDRGGK